MSAAPVNSKAIHLPDLEEPTSSTAKEGRICQVVAAWFAHKDAGPSRSRLAQLSQNLQGALVPIGMLLGRSIFTKGSFGALSRADDRVRPKFKHVRKTGESQHSAVSPGCVCE